VEVNIWFFGLTVGLAYYCGKVVGIRARRKIYTGPCKVISFPELRRAAELQQQKKARES
jgi:hypothetical protein